MLRKIIFTMAVSIASLGAADAQSAGSVLEDFGFFGRWAPDCSKPPGPDNSTRQTMVTSADEVRWTEDTGSRASRNRYRVIEAERLAPDKIRVRIELNGAILEDLVVVKEGGKVRTMSNKMIENGQYLVADGIILSIGRPTPWMTKCR